MEVEERSGNVFADLGLPNPEERIAKAGLAIRIAGVIRTRRLTQAGAARIVKIDQPKASRLLRGQLSGFSTERLMQFLALLGRDIENAAFTPSWARPRRGPCVSKRYWSPKDEAFISLVRECRVAEWPLPCCL